MHLNKRERGDEFNLSHSNIIMNVQHAVLHTFFLPIGNYDTSVEIKKEFHIYYYDIAEYLTYGEETRRERKRLKRAAGSSYFTKVRYRFYGVI